MRRTIRLQVRYRRRADLAAVGLALVVMLAGGLMVGQPRATAETTVLPEPVNQDFYLSLATYQGDQVKLSCAPGYHVASLWEILDTSNLRYNTSLGKTAADSGAGPPTAPAIGWVRTGYDTTTTGIIGNVNCEGWTRGDSEATGTWVRLPNVWTAGLEDLLGWEVAQGLCSNHLSVWCIEGGNVVYLPVFLRL